MWILHVGALLITAVVMAAALAHALEMPGKLRLSRSEYFAVQRIYYPGFTIAGALEIPAALLAVLSALLTTDSNARLWLRAIAACAMIAVVVVYWVKVHAVNRLWLTADDVSEPASRFLGATTGHGKQVVSSTFWQAARRRWEWGHVIRAALSLVALVLLGVALGAP